ncbi:MAG: glycosyltransferase family 2 protein [Winogradskyella sp.]|uniref:glycosyltransferase family 2 protein n=1 Tax=Winogradskyella sp. TaxID=1883156 RepID=UPI00385CAB45
MAYKFTIIIPVYNEEDNLARLESELSKYINIASVTTAVLFVNDGSTDTSANLIESMCELHTAFKFISFKENQGLSTALKAGFDAVDSEWVGYMDADLQTTPNDFNRLLAFRNDYELVTGVRTNRKDDFIKKISSKISNGIRRAFTKDGINDTGCPLKVFKTDYAKRIPMFKGLHRFLPAMVLLQNGCVKQVTVQHFPRLAGTSKFGVWNRVFGTLIDCFAFLWMKRTYIHYHIDKSHL